ncbi:hypothetical protein CEXT_133861 [Caerostris extrusa]|uniref:Ribosomal protein L2 n=1 Tax=Caerostris extrusa TaxID=172846 RepID=A0AAV4V667_CAEEX|nr:hypothetical protein CEXT_133861 [Caerostris extrusa]
MENKSGLFRKKVMALRPLRSGERVMYCRNVVTQSTHYLETRRLNSGGEGRKKNTYSGIACPGATSEMENKSGRLRKKGDAITPIESGRKGDVLQKCSHAIHLLPRNSTIKFRGKGEKRILAVESHVQRATSVSCSPF